ncbi:MAG: CARDB domain-containing protein [bacterium]
MEVVVKRIKMLIIIMGCLFLVNNGFGKEALGAPNLTHYTPSGWDYPIVPSSVPNTHKVDTLYGNQTTYIDWAIQNNGDANATGRFYTYFYIDGTYIQSWYTDGLSSGYWTYVDDWQRTLSVGYHTLKIVIDATNAISESNENDNSYERQFYWQGKPNLTYYTPSGWDYPIVPSSVPNTHKVDTLYGNQTTYIDWAIQNNGDANATGRFYTYFYIDGTYIQSWYTDGLSSGYWTYVDDWQRTLSVGYHTLKIVIDATNAISESNENDNSYERQFYWQGKPNLTYYTPSGWDYPIVPSSVPNTHKVDTLYGNQTTYIDWAIQNNGDANASGRFYTYFYIDGTYIQSWYTDGLSSGYWSYVDDWQRTLSVGYHTLKIVIDATNAIVESNENDNSYERQFYWQGKPNLTYYTPSGWDYPIVPSSVPNTHSVDTLYGNQITYIDWAIQNNGNANAAGRFHTYFYIDGTYIQSWYTDGLSSGYWTYVDDWQRTLSSGSHTLKIVIDATNAIAESNENDNSYERQFYWSALPALPDLVVTSLTITPSTPVGAQPAEIKWRVDNDGSADIPVSIRFYTKLYIDESLKKTWYTDGLKTTQYISDTYTETFSIGSHKVRLETDVDNVVSESNEDNNKKEDSFTVIRIQPPTNLTATVIANNTVKLNWDWSYDNSVLWGFYIYRSQTNNFVPSNSNYIGNTSNDVRYYEDRGVPNVGTYYYKVTAVDWYSYPPDDESVPSNQASVIITPPQDITPPSAPTNLTVTNPPDDDGTHLNLTWTASTDDVAVAYYRVYESTSPNISEEIYDAYYEPTGNSLQAYDLIKGIKYYYKVLAIDTSGNESSLSNRAEGIPKDIRQPDPPTNLSAVGNDGYVSLSWDYSWDAGKWNIYRQPGINTSDYEKIDYTYSNSFTDYSVTNDTTYYYKIRAESYEGVESNDSNVVQATPTMADLPPSAPAGLAAYGDNESITLVWRKDHFEQDFAGFNIYRDGTKQNSYPIKEMIYEDRGLTNGRTYNYQVKTVDKGDNESIPISIDAIPNPVKVNIISINGYSPGTYYTDTNNPEPIYIEYKQEGQISYIEFQVVDVTGGKEGSIVYSEKIYQPPPTFVKGNPIIIWDGKDKYKGYVPPGVYEFRLVAYQILEPIKGVLTPPIKEVGESQTRILQRTQAVFKVLKDTVEINPGDSKIKKIAYTTLDYAPCGDARDIAAQIFSGLAGEDINTFVLVVAGVGFILDVGLPGFPGDDIVINVLKKIGKIIPFQAAGKLGEVGMDLLMKNKEACGHLFGFLSKNEDLAIKLLKTSDDAQQLGEFFVKYGDEGGTLLKKFGDDMADEAFEVYKRGGELKNTRGIAKGIKGVGWLEEGNESFGWKHIFGRHIDGTLEVNISASFFPTGRRIERAIPKTLPNVMKDSEVEELIYESIRRVDPIISGDKLKYIYQPSKYGIDEMWTITTQEGKIITTYPIKGPNVWKWNVDKQIWELQ